MILHEAARFELEAAVDWYEQQREGLGLELADAVNATLSWIARAPRSFPRHLHDPRIHKARVGRFPYTVFFVVRSTGAAHVIAVAHAKRKPDYWAKRAR